MVVEASDTLPATTYDYKVKESHPHIFGTWTEAAVTIWKERYLHRNDDGEYETIEERLWSVAHSVGSAELKFSNSAIAEKYRDEFYNMMVTRRFLPNSPTLMNAGKNNGLNFSACFVLGIEDDINGIFDTIRRTALIHKSGGGTGFSFGRIREKDALVKGTQRSASGPVSFLKVFDAATEAIKQGGMRRGANMAIMPVDHPDILEFIDCKLAGGVTNFNISVGMSKKFMDKVLTHDADDSFELISRVDGSVHSIISAKLLWTKLVDAAWASGDPGLMFIDVVNSSRANPNPEQYTIEATNPCLSGDTMIATTEGPRSFKDLAEDGSDVLVYAWNPKDKQPVIRWMRKPRLTRKSVPVVEIEFDSGLVVKATPDHNFYTFRGNKIMAKELKVGQSVRAFAASTHRDGQVRVHAGDSSPKYLHRLMYEALVGEVPEGMIVHHRDHNPMNNDIENFVLYTPEEHNSHHYPKRHANGLKGHKNFPEVLAAAKARREAEVGNHKVISIREAGYEDVYNGTVDDVHTYIICDPNYRGKSGDGLFSGIVSANCGEQGLPNDDACNLGSLNLSKYVEGPMWTKDVDGIDWALLKRDVHLAVRFLDNVIETNPIDDPAVIEQVRRSRRIGLGVMGWADMLILLNIPYASQKARDLAEELIQFIQDEAEYETIQLATERGTFPDWEQSIYYPDTPRRNSTLTMVAPTGSISILAGCSSGIEPLFELTYKHRSPAQPDRILTIASDAVVKYITRQKFMNTAHVLEHIEQNGTINNYTGAVDVSKFRPMAHVLATAMEIGWEDHVLMQAAWQTQCENGISKTINMLNSATRDEVERAYILAYNTGCRGITVFRDGCKGYDFQVLRRVKEEVVEEAKTHVFESIDGWDKTYSQINIGSASVEPFTVSVPSHIHTSRPGNTRTVVAPEGKVHVVMNEDKYGLVEVFMIIGKAGSDIQAFAESLGRMVSLQLRSCDPSVRGDTVAKIAHQLRGISGSGSVGFGPNQVRSLPDALGLVLEQHQNPPFEGWIEVVADATKTPENVQTHSYSGALCPDCGSIKMVKAEGCTKCLNCGYSKC